MNERKFILTGLIFVVIGIMLSATAAHYLVRFGITGGNLQSFKIGNTYLIYSGLGMLALGGIVNKFNFEMNTSFYLILTGTILFSGSVFLFAILRSNEIQIGRFFTFITPTGGILMIAGWAILLIQYLRS